LQVELLQGRLVGICKKGGLKPHIYPHLYVHIFVKKWPIKVHSGIVVPSWDSQYVRGLSISLGVN
jgi:hypothetical protein